MWEFAGLKLESRLLLGTARYPSPAVMRASIETSATGMITVSLRRESAGENQGSRFWAFIRDLGVEVLPNTAGCHSVEEAVTTAKMARDLFETPRIKLEVIGDQQTLQPDPFGLVEAAAILVADGFTVLPYTTTDLVLGERLLDAGCEVLMPWGAPIGTGRGLADPEALRAMRHRFPEVPLIVDAGLGRPSHAVQAMEMGFDGVLLNTAVSSALDPVLMAKAFRLAVEAGRAAFEAGPMKERSVAVPSTPVVGRAFTPMSSREAP